MKKFLKVLLATCLVASLVACQSNASDEPEAEVQPTPVMCEDTTGEISLESINEFLNESGDMGEGSKANVVAVVPIAHVDGPREESDFYAFVNFKYVDRSYVKYQITYLSCTCRAAKVNYWQTAYVELTLPESGDIKDSEIKYLSFDEDAEGHYLAGFWGDSSPIPTATDVDYPRLKAEYIPYFFGKNYEYISSLDFIEDISNEEFSTGEGREGLTIDAYAGASVSTNNIIRMLNAIFEYHATDEYFQ